MRGLSSLAASTLRPKQGRIISEMVLGGEKDRARDRDRRTVAAHTLSGKQCNAAGLRPVSFRGGRPGHLKPGEVQRAILKITQDCADDRRPFSRATGAACGGWPASYSWARGCAGRRQINAGAGHSRSTARPRGDRADGRVSSCERRTRTSWPRVPQGRRGYIRQRRLRRAACAPARAASRRDDLCALRFAERSRKPLPGPFRSCRTCRL
jgi:hypothetical protein